MLFQIPREFYESVVAWRRLGFTKVGFSGVKAGMTPGQKNTLRAVLNELKGIGVVEFHHSCCKGAEEEAHYMAQEIGAVIVGHPQLHKEKDQAQLVCQKMRAPEMVAKCKMDIVLEVNLVIAAPGTIIYDPHNSTWFMVSFTSPMVKQKVKSMFVLEPENAVAVQVA